MYNVPKFIPKVYLIHRSGQRWEFKSLEVAAETIYRWGLFSRHNANHDRVGTFFKEKNSNWGNPDLCSMYYYEFIVRDEIGGIITPDDIQKARKPYVPKWRSYHTERQKVTENHFRTIPIPYTRCRRGGSHYYRKICTTQEHRENDFLKYDEDAIEYDIKARPNRTFKNLPNSWDDIPHSDYKTKNWKKYRKYQWKEKK